MDNQFTSSFEGKGVINADVLDAWFPPSPLVIERLKVYSNYWQNMSPPTCAEGLIEAISNYYSVSTSETLVGAGSSALWFLYALSNLNSESTVLLIEPGYGEYHHVCSNVVGCNVEYFSTSVDEGFMLDLEKWVDQIVERKANFAILINPNNPSGVAVSRLDLMAALNRVPESTQVLIDEAYMDFWDPDQSLLLGPIPPNVTVISSFSKRFALSGLRVAMMRSNPSMVKKLQVRTPPWAVSMPAQIAGCAALLQPEYYKDQYSKTHEIRRALKVGLEQLGYMVIDTCANWLLFEVMEADSMCRSLEVKGLFVRNVGKTAPSLANRWVRIAVKDERINQRILEILESTAN